VAAPGIRRLAAAAAAAAAAHTQYLVFILTPFSSLAFLVWLFVAVP